MDDHTIDIIRPGAYGDSLMCSALLPGLKKMGLTTRIACWSCYSSILQAMPYLDEVLFYEKYYEIYPKPEPGIRQVLLYYPNDIYDRE